MAHPIPRKIPAWIVAMIFGLGFLINACNSAFIPEIGYGAAGTRLSTEEASSTASAGSPSPNNIDIEKTRPYNAQSFWNTPIGKNPKIDPHSDQMVATIGLDNEGKITTNPDEYSRTFYYADSSTPRYSLKCERYKCTIVTPSGVTKTGTLENVPIPDGAQPAGGTDGSMVIIDKNSLTEYNLWGVKRSEKSIRIQNGSVYNLQWDGTPEVYGSGGAGLPYSAGVIHPWEIAQGHIDHVIGFSYPFPDEKRCVFPASKTDGNSSLESAIPEGAHLQLDPSLTDADFNRMGLSRTGKIIAKALQKYGMVLINYAGRPKVYVENLTDNPLAKEKWSSQQYSLTSTTIASIPYQSFRVIALPEAYWNSTADAPMHGQCYAYPSSP